MRHRVLMILLLLVVGAIVNVAVAWGLEWWDTRTPMPWYPPRRDISWLGEYVPDHSELGRCYRSAGGSWISTEWYNPTDRTILYVGTIQTGWPCHSMTGEWVSTENNLVRSMSIIHFGSLAHALPFRPLWPGFAINTVFYAFVLWLLFAAPFALRRRRRIRRGLCPKCAYDLRGTESQVCPECGATK